MSRTLFWTGFLLWSLLSGCTGLGHRPEALVHVEYEQPNPVGGSSTAFVQAELRGAASEVKPPPLPAPDAKPIHAETQFHDKTSATPGNLPNLDILPQLGGMKTPGTNTSPAVGGKKREPLLVAFELMLDGKNDDAMKQLRTYDDATQEVYLRLLPPIVNLVKKHLSEMSPQEVAVLIDQFSSQIDILIPRSELIVNQKCFCSWVGGFGKYQALPDNHAFLAGTDSRIGEQVQLYIELKNFESKQMKDGDFLTKLACKLELHDVSNRLVWSQPFDTKDTTHIRRAPMHDLASNYSFYVPAIPAGAYRLTIRITDETNPKSPRVASESLVFRVTPAVGPAPRK